MSTIPIANQPITPTEMIVSSVMRESEEVGLGFEFESAGFMTDGKFPRRQKMDTEAGARSMPSAFG